MSQQIDEARRDITAAVGAFLRAVAASPDTHQARRDHARQHGTYSDPMPDVGGNCQVTYLADGSLQWRITPNALSGDGEVVISERARTWVVLDINPQGALAPVTDSNQIGSALQGPLLQAVASDVTDILHKYTQAWLTAPTPAAQSTTTTTPLQAAQQLRQQVGKRVDKSMVALIWACLAVVAGWCCFLFGWFAAPYAVYLVNKERKKLNGTPMPTRLKVTAVITGVAVVSTLAATAFYAYLGIDYWISTPY